MQTTAKIALVIAFLWADVADVTLPIIREKKFSVTDTERFQ